MTTRQAVLTRLIESIVGISRDHPVRVAVDGPDTAGKTTLADELAAALSGIRPAIRVSVDDYIRPAEQRPQSPGVPAAGYFDDNFDLAALIAGYLTPFGPGGDRTYLAADGTTGSAPYDAVLLVDGVFLLQAGLRPYWDIGICLHIGEDEMLRRGLLRDRDRYGGEDATRGVFETQFVPGWRAYQAQHDPAAAATIVIDHDDPSHPAIRPGSASDGNVGRQR
ncbi:uridine kinase [Kribbella sp. NBC_00662]|uniref:uridine kinase n=1 Tax=Kribbella sp. NBC_00662 TaxID=2975969 RepID=UPI003249D084